MVCSVGFRRSTRSFWYGTLRKRKQKRDVQLDHLYAPIFVLWETLKKKNTPYREA